VEIILNELKNGIKSKNPYTHIGFSVYIYGYTYFIECAKAVKINYPEIITIAGNIGSLFKNTNTYVDYVYHGDGITFFREIFNETVSKPYILELYKNGKVFQLVTKLGCPNKCDFCVTSKLFQGRCTNAFFSPEQVYNHLKNYQPEYTGEMNIYICEPQAITSLKWWYKLFKLFKKEKRKYNLFLATTTKVIKNIDLELIEKSSLKISAVMLGIESFRIKYNKNRDIDMKQIMRKLRKFGILSYITYIIGFDYHNRKNIWEEVNQLAEIQADINSVVNLRPLPGTSLFQKMEMKNRLLNVPNDFHCIPGFLSFKHPNLKPGFEEMLPLMIEIENYLSRNK